jgi:acetoin utilization protein AcuB
VTTVADLMRCPALTAAPDTSIEAARRLMDEHAVRHLAVVEDGLLVGLVSERDLRDERDGARPLREVMVTTVFVASPEMPLRRAARILSKRRLGVLPVLRGRTVVGIVSVVDVLRAVSEHRDTPAPAG